MTENPHTILALVIIIAFLAEYLDSSLGMGYGTTLTPVLLLLGYEPLQVVPAVLLSELVTGILAGIIHQGLGNVDLIPRNFKSGSLIAAILDKGVIGSFRNYLPLHLKIVIVISSCSVIGTVAAVFLSLHAPANWLKIYIGAMVLAIGISIFAIGTRERRFAWKRILSLGIIASFNKGLSGGGYGPVVTGGQILAGIQGKNAVAITSLSEGLTCLVGVVLYCLTRETVDWALAPALAAGSVLSVPFAAFTVKYLKTNHLRWVIGVATTILGILTLGNALF